jgi:ribonuclease R
VLGDVDDPGVDVDVVLRHLQIPDAFPRNVLDQAAEFGDDPQESDMEGRLDLRDQVTVTIDGETAKDFDDAISVESRPGGGFRLGVHIADVSHYVAERSALDREALHRGTSVYFPDRAVPMLPEALSNGLCSLRPDVPRLTVSAFLDVDSSGQVGRRRFATSVIQSRRRLTYGEVYRVLEEPRDSDQEEYGEVLALLRRANDLREALYRRRIADGSLDLDLPEVNLILDDAGEVTAIEPAERNVAHRLIEELMIAANSAVAAEVDSNEVPAMHRVHPPPDLDTLEELRTALAAIGLKFEVTREALHPSVLQRLLSHPFHLSHSALSGSDRPSSVEATHVGGRGPRRRPGGSAAGDGRPLQPNGAASGASGAGGQ